MALQDFCVFDYLNARLVRLGIEISEIELTAISIQIMPDVQLGDIINTDNIRKSDKVCLSTIKDILLAPDIQEGGFSIKYDKDALTKWYNSEVQRLGLGNDPTYSLTPKIRDASNFW